MATKLSPSQVQALTRKVNQELTSINAARHTGMPLKEITTVLADNGLDASKVQEHLHGDEGRLHVQVSDEIWLTLTWMRMSSGRYEIVAYASSQHDDHRDPYTTVMDSTTKRKQRDKLNKTLDPVNKTYYQGKGQAMGVIQDAIAACGFDWHAWEDATTAGHLPGDDGRLSHPVPIGNGIYMACSWHKMGSGRYEIVAYAS